MQSMSGTVRVHLYSLSTMHDKDEEARDIHELLTMLKRAAITGAAVIIFIITVIVLTI